MSEVIIKYKSLLNRMEKEFEELRDREIYNHEDDYRQKMYAIDKVLSGIHGLIGNLMYLGTFNKEE